MSAVDDPTLSPVKRALAALQEMRAKLHAVEAARTEPLAIVGMGCRFPGGADSPRAFWRLLVEGRDAIAEPPPGRLDPSLYDADPDAPGKLYTRTGGYLEQVDRFDAAFFGISPREAESIDPQQRLLLEVACEALEDAGIPLERLIGSSTGVFVGVGSEDYSERTLRNADLSLVDAYSFTGGDTSLASGRISYALGLEGPSLVVDTACSSSLVAIHIAAASLRNRECDLALVGGANLNLSPAVALSMCRAHALSPDGRCKTFDASADGYGRSEGAGMLALRRLSDAIAAGDRVLAVVRGTAINQDGASSGLTVPNGLAQQALLRRALAEAGIAARDVGYIEAHGTGTALGDPIEVAALTEVFREGRARDRPLRLGSVKTNIGHAETAAGVAGVIKVVLSLRAETLPAHLHLKSLNSRISLDAIPAEVPTRATPWPASAEPRIAGVSSFGMSGTNAHVIVAEAPRAPTTNTQISGALPALHAGLLLPLSARSEEALLEVARSYRAFLVDGEGPRVDLLAVVREAGARRSHHAHRLALVGERHADLVAGLDSFLSSRPIVGVSSGRRPPGRPPRVVMVFSGQGGQWPGMGRHLIAKSRAARESLEAFDALLRPAVGWSLFDQLAAEGDASRMGHTDVAQPVICALQIALVAAWRELGVSPEIVAGHSVGEVAAAYVAGALRLEDAVRVVAVRGQLMERTVGAGRMVSLEISVDEAEAAARPFGGRIGVAALNGPNATVLAGDPGAIEEVSSSLRAAGKGVHPMPAPYAFHSAQMEPLLNELVGALSGLAPVAPNIPIISTLSGGPAAAGDYGAEYWGRHARAPVRFAEAIDSILRGGSRVFLEIGPHPQLTMPILQVAGARGTHTAVLPSLRRGADDVATMLGSLGALYAGGHDLDWTALYGAGPRGDLTLPSYPWQRQRYWLEPSSAKALGQSATKRPRAAGAHRLERDATSIPDEAAGWLHELVWHPAPRAAHATTTSVDARPVLILTDRSGTGRGLAEALTHAGARTILVERGVGFAQLGEHRWRIDPTSAADWERLFVTALPAGVMASVVSLFCADAAAVEAAEGPSSEHALQLAAGSTLHLLQSLARRGHAHLSLCTRGAQAVGVEERSDDVCLAQATTWGLGATLALEHPELRPSLIDLDPRGGGPEEIAALAEEVLQPEPSEVRVALRGGTRLVARLIASPSVPPSSPPALRGDATYLVSGAFGALGLEVARSLSERGAKHLVLLGRSAPSAAAKEIVAAMERAGARVVVARADVAHREQLEPLFDEIGRTLPPLRGVVHLAGVLDDGVLMRQDVERLSRVMAPKVAGSWNLHALTLGSPLDFFVMFSSMAALLGSPGQGTYAAANAFLDGLAHFRRGRGLPGLAIGWGPFADAGMAASLSETLRRRIEERGFGSLPTRTALDLLARLAGSDATSVLAIQVADAGRLVSGLSPPGGPAPAWLSELAPASTSASAPAMAPRPWEAAPAALRLALLADHVRTQVASVLRLPPERRVDDGVPLRDLGLDSLMAMLLRGALGSTTGTSLPGSFVFDHPTVAALAGALHVRLGGESVPATVGAPDAAALAEADRALEVAAMGDEEVDAELAARLAELEIE